MHSIELVELINKWQKYLKLQKNYSDHTLRSYKNDLDNFLNFIKSYDSDTLSISGISKVDIRLIRSWLAKRQQDKYIAASNARSLSAIKNFYKYLEQTIGVSCHAVFSVKNPKKALQRIHQS